jgi:hypothetical protein
MRPDRIRIVGLIALFLLLSSAVWVLSIYVHRPVAYGLENLDLIQLFRPNAVFLQDEIRRGNIPLWNPYQMAGTPFLATHMPAALYPPILALLYVLPTDRALEAHTILHWAIAGFFTWLLAARLGLGLLARLIASLVYMLSGEILFGAYSPPALATQAWLPAMLWSLDGLLRDPRPGWALGLALVMSLSFLGGWPQGFVHELVLGAAFAAFGLVVLTPAGLRIRVIALGAAAGVVSLGLVAPQLIPVVELAARSVRSFQSTTFEAAAHPAIQAAMLVKGLFGRLATDAFGPSGIQHTEHTRLVLYPPRQYLVAVPALTLPLIVCGWMARKQRAYWIFFLAAAVVTGCYTLGTATPVFELTYRFFLGGWFRGPVRAAFAYVFPVAMLVGIGIEGVRNTSSATRGASRVRAATAVAVALLVLVGLHSRIELSEAHPAVDPLDRGAPQDVIESLREEAEVARVFVEPSAFPSEAFRQFHAGMSVHLEESSPGTDGDHYRLIKMGQMNRISTVPDYDALLPRAYHEYFGRPHAHGETPWHGQVELLSLRDPRKEQEILRLLDLMSVRRYLMARTPRTRGAESLKRTIGPKGSVAGIELFERKQALPRAYVVGRILNAKDGPSALEVLRGDSFDPMREAVVVGATAAARDLGISTGRAEIVVSEPERVEINATCDGACLVVLTDLHYPGWTVSVNGAERNILLVNGLFRGVSLKAGEHRIVYRYEPLSFAVGLWLCAASSLLVFASGIGLWLLRATRTSPARGIRRQFGFAKLRGSLCRLREHLGRRASQL